MNLRRKLTFLIALIITAAANADDCGEYQCFNVGSFNIKHFGNNGPANTDSEIERLVERIASDANLDIVVLQEIDVASQAWLERLLPELIENGYKLAGHGDFGGANKNRQQHVVLMFRNATIEQTGTVRDITVPTFYENGDCKYDSVRPPTVGRFQVKDAATEFAVIGVHLKSQIPPDGNDDCDDEIRAYQARVMANDAIAMSYANPKLITFAVGDFNGEFQAPEFNVFREAEMDSVVPANCETDSRTGCTYLSRRFAGVIDHIVVSKDIIEDYWVSTTIEKPSDVNDYISTQSDHALVWASFLVADE